MDGGSRKVCDDESISRHETPKGLLRSNAAGASEQVHRFGERWPRRDEREGQLIKRIHARNVVGLVGVDDRDEGTCVGERHRRFWSSASDSLKAAPVWRALGRRHRGPPRPRRRSARSGGRPASHRLALRQPGGGIPTRTRPSLPPRGAPSCRGQDQVEGFACRKCITLMVNVIHSRSYCSAPAPIGRSRFRTSRRFAYECPRPTRRPVSVVSRSMVDTSRSRDTTDHPRDVARHHGEDVSPQRGPLRPTR